MRDGNSRGKSTVIHASKQSTMGNLLQEPDAQRDLGVMIHNIVKINNLIYRASRKSNAVGLTDCPHSDLLLSPCYAHTIVDANALDEDSCLSDSDIDLLMLIGEGLSRQQISSELGVDTTQISKWRDEIVRKARLSQT